MSSSICRATWRSGLKPPHLITEVDDLYRLLQEGRRILCLYSGGLDGSWLLNLLAARTPRSVIALNVVLGGEPIDAAGIELCRRLGIQLLTVDRTDEFVSSFVAPAICAHATYLGTHPICASLSRPAIAAAACEIATVHNCSAIVHTADSSQNSLRRFNGALHHLGFPGHFGSPFAESLVSRDEKRRVLAEAGIDGFEARINSRDSNIWGREFEAGRLDDPEQIDIPDALYAAAQTSMAPLGADIAIGFRSGLPVSLNGNAMDLAEIIRSLNAAGSAYKLGRYVALEELDCGVKVQEVREMPAAQILFDAYRRLESATVPAEVIREKLNLEQLWVREAVEGRWFALMRQAAQSFITAVASRVAGVVGYCLAPGALHVRSVKAERPLYIRSRDEIGLFAPEPFSTGVFGAPLHPEPDRDPSPPGSGRVEGQTQRDSK